MSVFFDNPLYDRLWNRWHRKAEARALAQSPRYAEIEALRHDGDRRGSIMLDEKLGLTMEIWEEQQEIFDRINPRPWYQKARWWLNEHPWLDRPTWELRASIQRGRHGFATPDTFSLFRYLARVTADSVDQLRRERHGYPGSSTNEEWEAILTQIVSGFRAVERADDLLLTDEEQEAARVEVDKAMDLYKKWFFHLWD